MKIVVFSNDHSWTYNLRRELLKCLLERGHEVTLLLPYGEKVELLKEMGCSFVDLNYSSRGTNPLQDLKLFWDYCRHLSELKPDLVLSYTIKPNVYGGMACRLKKIPYMVNVTGLGMALHGDGLLRRITEVLYREGIRKARYIFFQNSADCEYMLSHSIAKSPYEVIPGSGVNTEYYYLSEYPAEGTTEFILISRLLKQKGADEFFSAVRTLKAKYSDVNFHVCGQCTPEYEDEVKELTEKGMLTYYGAVSDIRPYLDKAHCAVLPSYHEGMANALLESSSYGRPVVATTVPGCRETFVEGVTGFGCEVANAASLTEAMEKFHLLPYEKKREMALSAREYVKEHFDRTLVLEAYLKQIDALERELETK